MPTQAEKISLLLWRATLFADSLVGWFCLAWLLSTPSESSGAVLLGYSLSRITLALVLTIPSVLFTYLSVGFWRGSTHLNQMISFFNRLARINTLFRALLGLSLAFLLIFWILFFLPEKRSILWFGSFSLYVAIARPLLLYGIVFTFLWSAHLLIARYGLNTNELKTEKSTIRLGLLLFFGVLFVVGLITTSGIGLGFDASVWNAPGTPVLISQVFIVLIVATLLLIAALSLGNRLRKKIPSLKSNSGLYLNLCIAILIWLIAAGLWISQPAPSTYYDTPPLPPNYQSYPLSDAFNHDVIANNVLIGEGFRFGGQVAIRRPVYVMFLAGLEGLLGANYDAVVIGQVLVLALFPAFLFLLGTKLHSRLTGALLAGVITFREANSIILGDVINTSHAKLLMADLPTALMVAGLTLAVVAWLCRDSRNLLAPLLVGGLLGWSILLRSQSLTLAPFLVLLALLVWGWRAAWRPILLFILGVALVASPWIVRNRVLMGHWAIEDAVVSGFLANRYSFNPGTFGLPFLPGESEGEYYARQMAHVRDFAFQNSRYVASFVVDNFVRNQLLNFLATPLSLQLRDLESHVRELPYWPGWEGELAPESYLPMMINLALISLGVALAWKRFRWVGLVPLFINIGFTLNLALARVSGWRYNLPIDWTVLLYYAMGIAQVVIWVLLALKSKSTKEILISLGSNIEVKKSRISGSNSYRNLAVGLLALTILGASFLLIETLSSPRYSRISSNDAISILEDAKLRTLDAELEQQQLVDLISLGQAAILNGRALHPRYYRAGEGEPGRDFALVDPMDFARISFYLIGSEPASLLLRIDSPYIEIPASSDVVVFRCGDTLEAAALIVKDRSGSNLYVSSDLAQGCPEPDN